jgi:hypothetical protein
MDVAPILNDHNNGHSYGYQNGQRRGYLHWQGERKKGDGNERFAESEGGADKGGEKEDGQDMNGCCAHAVKMRLLASILA